MLPASLKHGRTIVSPASALGVVLGSVASPVVATTSLVAAVGIGGSEKGRGVSVPAVGFGLVSPVFELC